MGLPIWLPKGTALRTRPSASRCSIPPRDPPLVQGWTRMPEAATSSYVGSPQFRNCSLEVLALYNQCLNLAATSARSLRKLFICITHENNHWIIRSQTYFNLKLKTKSVCMTSISTFITNEPSTTVHCWSFFGPATCSSTSFNTYASANGTTIDQKP